uniref:Uncharacterized protein n=1 Tax=Klebsiella pneumoniae TaxID=573 RepID=A0A8B0SSD6_KLEPN|nr:hypothetical protein [Klebsiella pneumoniae]
MILFFSTTDMVYDSGSASLSIPWTKREYESVIMDACIKR